ncbi:MAG TPA: hypothetical protein VKU01_00375 [Bryobacteraceae bacterium]|nr:hypothetical protein [Bryobacteraceae bacterium]
MKIPESHPAGIGRMWKGEAGGFACLWTAPQRTRETACAAFSTLPKQLLACIAILLFAAAALFAQSGGKPISKKGLLDAIHIGGLSNAELVELVRTRGVSFALTPDIETELRQAHASAELIEAVRTNNRSGAPPAKPSAMPPPGGSVLPPPAPVYPQTPGIYISKAGRWTPLVAEGLSWKHEGILKKFGTAGIGKGSLRGEVPGNRSPVAVSDPATFLICTEPGANVSSYVLLRMHRKNDNREFRVPAETLLHPRADKQDVIPFSSRRVADRLFTVTFSEGTGDYGFLLPGATEGESQSGKVLSFRVGE